MAKVQDTYNPVTGEYVKRVSDWITLDGSNSWSFTAPRDGGNGKSMQGSLLPSNSLDTYTNANNSMLGLSYDSKVLPVYYLSNVPNDSITTTNNFPYVTVSSDKSGWSESLTPTSQEMKAYFYGWKMANSDGTSPYYKSEVPYTPTTWAEWTTQGTAKIADSTGITIVADGAKFCGVKLVSQMKPSTKYGFLYNVISSTATTFMTGGGLNQPLANIALGRTIGNNKFTGTTSSSVIQGSELLLMMMSTEPAGNSIKLKDFRIFELPTGSQIEADFTNLTADELSAKYTFNGLCIKNWKKVTDGTGLTSTLPTASYAGYTPYKMIYQLATPEISYLTPKATIPLYDTNTIVETDTPSDCKADMTVGYRLKDGVTAVAGDITAPTPDYMSAVNSVSEDGLGKGIVGVAQKNLAIGTKVDTWTGWGNATVSSSEGVKTKIIKSTCSYASGNGSFGAMQSPGNRMINLEAGKNYNLSFLMRGNVPSLNYVYMMNSNGLLNQSIGGKTLNSPTNFIKFSVSFTPNEHTIASQNSYIMISHVGAIDTSMWFEIQDVKLEEGISDTSWVPAIEDLNDNIPLNDLIKTPLPTLRKIGTVADTYNPETGVLVQRIGKKVLDGTENWTQYTGEDAKNFIYYINISDTKVSFQVSTCSHFKNIDYAWSTPNRIGYYGDHGSNTMKYFQTSMSTIVQWKTYLGQQYANGTPVAVYYQLATPVITTLTKTALPTYKPTTVIESDSTVKGNVSTDYKLKANATPVTGDFIASPECVNDIKDLGNSIDVVSSVGRRNIVPNTNQGAVDWSWNVQNGVYTKEDIESLGVRAVKVGCTTKTTGWEVLQRSIDLSLLKSNTDYTISFDVYAPKSGNLSMSIVESNAQKYIATFPSHPFTANSWTHITRSVKTNYESKLNQLLYFTGLAIDAGTYFVIANLKIEEGTSESKWTPALEDSVPYNTIINDVYKTNILLNAPLRSIGDVKDRLFKDSDGKWKVERNIGEYRVSDLTIGYTNTNSNTVRVQIQNSINQNAIIQGAAFKTTINNQGINYGYHTADNEHFYFELGTLLIFINKSRLLTYDQSGVTDYFRKNPLVIQYQLATPNYETLSQELQTKLDNIPTFPEHNYVYTVTNDNLQPTLHVDYKKLSWLKSRLLLNSLKIYSRNLTDTEMIQNYEIEKERYGM